MDKASFSMLIVLRESPLDRSIPRTQHTLHMHSTSTLSKSIKKQVLTPIPLYAIEICCLTLTLLTPIMVFSMRPIRLHLDVYVYLTRTYYCSTNVTGVFWGDVKSTYMVKRAYKRTMIACVDTAKFRPRSSTCNFISHFLLSDSNLTCQIFLCTRL